MNTYNHNQKEDNSSAFKRLSKSSAHEGNFIYNMVVFFNFILIFYIVCNFYDHNNRLHKHESELDA